jgi:hypothetical protein
MNLVEPTQHTRSSASVHCLQSDDRVFTGAGNHDHPIPQTGKRAQIADATSFIPQSDMTVVSGHQQNAERI